ncbi:MAG: Stk1 family PASTA domain-containing Ser/Thr kinase [Acidimicrobiaceae bacterium]|nr:Stk1 family PASTA domain-containing Ser/Thr kinase [Acidimicrobiaceae bacterium]
MPDASAPIFSDRYQLTRHIARGGMAQVYMAQDLLLDRPVALKVLFPELSIDESFVRRFRREAQAAANLTHPNIVSIYDWGQGDRTYFIVMEYVDGETLSALIRRGPLDPHRAAAIGADVAAALEFAHRHNVIHRDVKPANVLIDRSGTVKVTDFGIARSVGVSDGLTQTGSVMGTATYFSPEQAQGQPVDARTDVYSLGVVLYEMVAGHPPFSGENPVSMAYKHVSETPVPLREINPTVPPAYEAIVDRAMAKSVDDRYQTAGELRSDLRKFLAGQPVAAERLNRDLTLAGAGAAMGAAAAATTRVAPPADRTMMAGRGPSTTVSEIEEERRPSHRALWIALIVAALVVAGVIAYLLLHQTGPATLTVPNVTGQPAAAAQSQLAQTGFTNVHQSTTRSDTVPDGQVIATVPAAGARAKANDPIQLNVSGGPVLVAVPDVVGKDQQDATAALEHAGFKVTVVTAHSDTVAQGLVIRTNPPGHSQEARGSEVQLTVSTGKRTEVIPSLVGKSPTEAGNTLGDLGLTSLQLTEASDTVPTGQVTRTSPPAGTVVAAGTTVTVYVSTGPAQVRVPSVVGNTQAQAQNALSNAGLTPQFTTQPVGDPTQNGLVQSQNPAGGNQANQGSTVQVVIGTFTPPPTTAPPPPPTTAPPPPPTTTPPTTAPPTTAPPTTPPTTAPRRAAPTT